MNSKNNIWWIKFICVFVLGIIVLSLVLSVAGCIDYNNNYGDPYASGNYGTKKVPPNVTITSHDIRTRTDVGSYYTYVDVSAHNYGGDGTAIIWVTVTQDGKQWTQSQSIYLASRESKDLTFTFRGPSFWGSTTYSQVWVENLRWQKDPDFLLHDLIDL